MWHALGHPAPKRALVPWCDLRHVRRNTILK
jgi:hypothetical protein